jgi:hypothetical protein
MLARWPFTGVRASCPRTEGVPPSHSFSPPSNLRPPSPSGFHADAMAKAGRLRSKTRRCIRSRIRERKLGRRDAFAPASCPSSPAGAALVRHGRLTLYLSEGDTQMAFCWSDALLLEGGHLALGRRASRPPIRSPPSPASPSRSAPGTPPNRIPPTLVMSCLNSPSPGSMSVPSCLRIHEPPGGRTNPRHSFSWPSPGAGPG